MSRLTVIKITTIIILALVFVVPAQAGGWATITLDEWPAQVVAGQPLAVAFMVRQHGISPMSGITPLITAWNPDTSERLLVEAEPQGRTGHYAAALTFPSAGQWEWSIQAFTMELSMPSLEVTEAGGTINEAGAPLQPVPTGVLPVLAGVAGLAGITAGLYMLLRKRARWSLALLAAGVILGSAGLIASGQSRAAQASAELASASAHQQQLGQNLFVAKGCVTCHAHSSIQNDGNIFIGMGPDLSRYSASPDYLRTWLKDPSAVKSSAQMPNLELKEVEIEALIAFINSGQETSAR
jgi:cytochrome c2